MARVPARWMELMAGAEGWPDTAFDLRIKPHPKPTNILD